MGEGVKLALTGLAGVYRAESTTIADHRGALTRLYCEEELGPALGDRRIVQINHTRTRSTGAVRGMHYQVAPHGETKVVRCTRGSIYDVVLDLRPESPTFKHWIALILSAENRKTVYVPEGCAHGFQTLEPDSELLYLHTAFYTPASEGGISCRDPRLDIRWPLPVIDLSTRDANHPAISRDFAGITV